MPEASLRSAKERWPDSLAAEMGQKEVGRYGTFAPIRVRLLGGQLGKTVNDAAEITHRLA